MTQVIGWKTRVRWALLLAIPVLAGLEMYRLAAAAEDRADRVEHTLRVQLSLQEAMSALKDAEASQRGYLLSSEERFLEPYRTSLASARRELESVREFTADNPRQQAALRQLGPLVDSKRAHMDENIARHRTARVSDAERAASIDRGAIIMDSIQSVVQGMHAEEERLLREREVGLRSATRRFYWSLAVGYLLIVLVVDSLYRAVKRYGRESAVAQEGLSRLNAELDGRVRARTTMLQAREELLATFVRHVPAAVAMLDRDMRYLQVSDRWCAEYSLRSDQMLGQSHYEIFPDLPERWKQIHRRCLDGETLRAEEDCWERADGGATWLRWEMRPWGERGGKPEGALIFSEDITARKRMEDTLRETEATTRTLLETAAQAILAVDEAGCVVLANHMAEQMFGYERDQLLGTHLEQLIPDRLRERHAVHRAEFGANPRTRPMGIEQDLWGLRKDGTEFPIEVSLSSVAAGRSPLYVSFVTDITERKQAERRLRHSEQELRALAGSLLTAQEDERRRIARDLHDDVTQRLAFLSIEIGKLASGGGPAVDVREPLHSFQSQILQISHDVRRMSHGLHPSVIEDFGLSTALEEFCEEFGKAEGIGVAFDGPVDDTGLSLDAASCLYRIAQESLRNAAKHAGATELRVSLANQGAGLRLLVTDNGAGFSPEVDSGASGLGLVSMKERIRMVNGSLSITSRPGHGTEITASVPFSGAGYETTAHSAG